MTNNSECKHELKIEIVKSLDSDEMKYLIRKLTKIQGFSFRLDFMYHNSNVICNYHPPKPKAISK